MSDKFDSWQVTVNTFCNHSAISWAPVVDVIRIIFWVQGQKFPVLYVIQADNYLRPSYDFVNTEYEVELNAKHVSDDEEYPDLNLPTLHVVHPLPETYF